MKISAFSAVLLSIFATAALAAVEYKDSPKEFTVTVDGNKFAINKKTAPSWGSQYSLTINGNKDLRLSAYAGIADKVFGGRGIGQLVPSKTPAKVTVFQQDKNSLTVRAEYAIAQVGKKNAPDYAGVKMVCYYSFADGIPGVAVNIRLAAQDRPAAVTALNASFGAKFTHYTTSDGKRIEYPAKSWSGIKGGFVVAEQGNIKVAATASARNPGKGFAWVNSKKRSLDLDQFAETRGFIALVKNADDVKKIRDFFNSVKIPAEKKKVFANDIIGFRESSAAAVITVAGHDFAINKKTAPSWGSQYSLTIDGNKNLRLSTYAGIDDEIFPPKGVGQLVPSKTPAKITVVEKTARTLTVRAEYAIAQVGKKNAPDYAGAKMVYYYSFTAGLPGVAVNIRLLAENRNVTVRALNSSCCAGFTRYTTSDGKTFEYPQKSWSNVKSEYVIAEQGNLKIALTSKTRNPSRGFSWISPANDWRKITIKPGEYVESRGFIAFVNDNAGLNKIKDFFSSIQIPAEKSKDAADRGDMVASPVNVAKDGWPVKWPSPIVVRRGAGWVRPDTTDTWGGNDNLSFTATVGFDSDFFYLRADVRDSFFRQTGTNGKIWAGDCMQVAFDPLNEKTVSKNLILLGFTVTDKPAMWCWDHPDKKYTASDISKYCRVRGSRSKTGYVYEVAIPWDLLKPFSIDRGHMGFNIVMLDDDGVGPRHWMGITDGIAGGKNPALYKPLYFSNPEKVLLANIKNPAPMLRMDSDTTVGEQPLNFSVAEMLPENLAGAKLTVTAGKKVWNEKLNTGFNSFRYTILPQEMIPGNMDISAVLHKDGRELYRTVKSTCIVTRKSVEDLCRKTESAADKLKTAISKLEKNGKNTAYFTNRIALAEYFVRMVRLDNSRDVLFRAPYTRTKKQMTPVTPEYRRWIYRRSVRNLNYCIKILNDGVIEAGNILAGKAPDLKVPPMPIGAKMEIRNGGFYLNGKEMFFLGPNTWQIHYTQLKDVAGAGMNFFDITGLSRRNTKLPIKPIDEDYVHEKLNNLFNPNVIYKSKDMGLYFLARQFAGCSYVQNLDTPDHYRKTEAANREIWRFEADQPHLLYLISHLESFTHEKNMPRFEKNMAQHLKNKYKTVEKVNQTLGTAYKEFTDFKERDRANPAVRYEIFLFEKEQNFKALRSSNVLKREFWKRPTTSHISTSHWTAWDTLRNCADFEELYEECDIAGYDAGVRLESDRYAASWEAVMMLCDFSRSLYPEKPVTNNETHNFPINCSYDVDPQFIYTAQMSEMLHGRNAGVMWKWEKDFHDPWGSYAFTRADSFHYASRAILDARRLPDDIAAFRGEKRQFRIFYSLPSFCDHGMYKKLSDLYQGTYFHGVAPGFITEKTLMEDKFADCKVILIPDTRRVSDAVFAKLAARAAKGVKIIRFGEKSLTMDEYGRIKPERQKILAKMPLFKVAEAEDYFPLIGRVFADNKIKATCEVTGKNGEKLWALEYRSTADGKLLYVINWNKKPLDIVLPPGKWQELFSGSSAPRQLTLKPLDIKLFRKK